LLHKILRNKDADKSELDAPGERAAANARVNKDSRHHPALKEPTFYAEIRGTASEWSSLHLRNEMLRNPLKKLRTIHEITRSRTKDRSFVLFRVRSWIVLLILLDRKTLGQVIYFKNR
jgi:hypothetical protein